MIAVLALAGIVITLAVVPSADTHLLNRESSIVRGSFRKVLSNSRLLKLNFGIMCLHILLMSSFVALPLAMEKAGLAASEHWIVYLVTMLVSFAAVVPFIIYAEKYRRMKQVFMGCVAVLFCAEVLLWLSARTCGASSPACSCSSWLQRDGSHSAFADQQRVTGRLQGHRDGGLLTSQFIGVAIGGSLGGWLYGLQGAGLVFIAGAVLAALWFLVSSTMKEPPYVSSLRITLSELAVKDSALESRLKAQPGVAEAIVVPEERSAYVKVDTKQTNRGQLEALVNSL
ncbi:inner membrane transport protein YajR-like [Nilaparvata lugens]|uniref:inner membrane transport protein YajR-like n=1 Tax=Nilaparvata lugens TaxID=108931 RepID=UPI00193E5379|nr:inner membrane transport protein YajR-like [Nilaparvata lugens]